MTSIGLSAPLSTCRLTNAHGLPGVKHRVPLASSRANVETCDRPEITAGDRGILMAGGLCRDCLRSDAEMLTGVPKEGGYLLDARLAG